MSLAQRHLKALNHSSFFLLLYFYESCTEPSQDIESSKFLLASPPWVIWSKARAQSSMTSSSCLLRSSHLHLSQLVILYFGSPRKFSWSHLQSATYGLHVDTPPSSMLSSQFMPYFCWGIPILFTLGNRCTSCYATHAAFPLGYLHPVYFRQQVHFLLCNLCSISKSISNICNLIISSF